MPVRSALKVTSLVKKVGDALEAPFKVRKDLIEKYKESEDEQGNIKLKKDKVEQFNKENMELLEQDVDIEFPKIKIEEIEHENDELKSEIKELNNKINKIMEMIA